MISHRFPAGALLGLALAFALARPVVAAEEPIPAKDRIVILLTVDGFPSWIWKDPTLVMPNLRRLAREGSTAETMTVSNPTVTWINHTTLVTGVTPRKHGVLFNGLLVRNGPTLPPATDAYADKADMVHVPTLYDAAFKAGLNTAQVDWVAILNSGTISEEFLEVPKPGGQIESELMEAGVVTAEDIRKFSKKNIVWRDAVWTHAATQIIEKHHPNLLLFHLLSTDAMNHEYGPGSLASMAAYANADRHIGDVLDALTRAGMRDRATIIVTTDHGFKKVTKAIHANVALRDAGLIRLKEDEKVESCDAYIIPEGGLAFVYVTDPAKRAELLPKLKTLCAGLEGVSQVVDGEDGPSLGMPKPEENQGMGDLVLYAKEGYAFRAGVAGPEVVTDSKNYLGTHGYPASDPQLDGLMVAWGYGIRPGVHLDRIVNLDIAPTLAELLGVSLPGAEGHPLRQILK